MVLLYPGIDAACVEGFTQTCGGTVPCTSLSARAHPLGEGLGGESGPLPC